MLKFADAIDLSRTFIVHGSRHIDIPTDTPWKNFPVTLDPVYRTEPEALDFHKAFRLPAAGEKEVVIPDAESRVKRTNEWASRVGHAIPKSDEQGSRRHEALPGN